MNRMSRGGGTVQRQVERKEAAAARRTNAAAAVCTTGVANKPNLDLFARPVKVTSSNDSHQISQVLGNFSNAHRIINSRSSCIGIDYQPPTPAPFHGDPSASPPPSHHVGQHFQPIHASTSNISAHPYSSTSNFQSMYNDNNNGAQSNTSSSSSASSNNNHKYIPPQQGQHKNKTSSYSNNGRVSSMNVIQQSHVLNGVEKQRNHHPSHYSSSMNEYNAVNGNNFHQRAASSSQPQISRHAPVIQNNDSEADLMKIFGEMKCDPALSAPLPAIPETPRPHYPVMEERLRSGEVLSNVVSSEAAGSEGKGVVRRSGGGGAVDDSNKTTQIKINVNMPCPPNNDSVHVQQTSLNTSIESVKHQSVSATTGGMASVVGGVGAFQQTNGGASNKSSSTTNSNSSQVAADASSDVFFSLGNMLSRVKSTKSPSQVSSTVCNPVTPAIVPNKYQGQGASNVTATSTAATVPTPPSLDKQCLDVLDIAPLSPIVEPPVDGGGGPVKSMVPVQTTAAIRSNLVGGGGSFMNPPPPPSSASIDLPPSTSTSSKHSGSSSVISRPVAQVHPQQLHHSHSSAVHQRQKTHQRVSSKLQKNEEDTANDSMYALTRQMERRSRKRRDRAKKERRNSNAKSEQQQYLRRGAARIGGGGVGGPSTASSNTATASSPSTSSSLSCSSDDANEESSERGIGGGGVYKRKSHLYPKLHATPTSSSSTMTGSRDHSRRRSLQSASSTKLYNKRSDENNGVLMGEDITSRIGGGVSVPPPPKKAFIMDRHKMNTEESRLPSSEVGRTEKQHVTNRLNSSVENVDDCSNFLNGRSRSTLIPDPHSSYCPSSPSSKAPLLRQSTEPEPPVVSEKEEEEEVEDENNHQHQVLSSSDSSSDGSYDSDSKRQAMSRIFLGVKSSGGGGSRTPNSTSSKASSSVKTPPPILHPPGSTSTPPLSNVTHQSLAPTPNTSSLTLHRPSLLCKIPLNVLYRNSHDAMKRKREQKGATSVDVLVCNPPSSSAEPDFMREGGGENNDDLLVLSHMNLTDFQHSATDFNNCMLEAKKLKSEADQETSDQQCQAIKYLRAVLLFSLCAYSNEMRQPTDTITTFTMYKETLNLIRHVCRPFQNCDTDDFDNKLAILSLRCQSILFLKLYSLRSTDLMDLHMTMKKSLTESSAEQEVRVEGDSLNGYLTITNYLMQSHQLWLMANQMTSRPNSYDFISTLNQSWGRLTIHSSVGHLYRYTQSGLHYLMRQKQQQHQQ